MGPHTLRVRSELLMETIRFAVANSPFYSAHLGDQVGGVSRLEDLRRLPTITKSDLVRHGDRMLTSDAFPARVGLSSGTMFGYGPEAPARAYQTEEEIELFRRLQRQLLDRDHGAPRGLSITIHNATHGDRFLPPAAGEFLAPLEKPFHFAHIEALLQSEFAFPGLSPRVEYLFGDLRKIKLLAFLLVAKVPDVIARGQIKAVFTNGDFLTGHWRTLLERLYGAPIFDVYGISEIAGATAIQCAGCGGFHMPPIVVPEVVELDDPGSPVREGFGELVLTSLCPFTTLQPLIRYRTGDIVEVLPPCPLVEDIGFSPVGRRSKSVVDRELGVLLPSGRVFEAIDDLADVSRVIFTPIPEFASVAHFGEPRYRLRAERMSPGVRSGDGLVAHVVVELNYDPRVFAAQADAVRQRLRERLGGLTSQGAAAVSQGRLSLEVDLLPPGSLADEIGVFHGSAGDVMAGC